MKKILILVILIIIGGIVYLIYSGKLSKDDLKNPNKVVDVIKNEVDNKDLVDKVKKEVKNITDEVKNKTNELKKETQKHIENLNK